MEITFKKSAIKDIQVLPPDIRDNVKDLLFEKIPQITNIKEINDLEKLKGFKNFYRIRIRDYRIGIQIDNSKITVIKILHHKEIYKYFP